MPAAPIPYRKLPGRGYGFGESSRLYLTADHLMLVTAVGFHETYRRFYFRDIQAVTLRKTVTGAVLTAILGTGLAFITIGLASANTPGETIGWSIPTGFFLGLLLYNLFSGPTCACEIHTAVQKRGLGPLNRLHSARKTLARLRPFIEAAQGAVPADELRARLDQARQYFAPAEAPPVINPAGS